MKSVNFLFSLLFLSVTLLAESNDSTIIRMLTPAQMKEDVLFFYDMVAQNHPNPYQVLNKEQYERKKQELLNSIDKPMTVYEFSIQMAQLHPFFDAHTYVSPPDDMDLFLQNNKCFYFHFGTLKVDENTLCFGETGVPDSLKNKRIITINDVESDSIFNKIATCMSHESPMYIKTTIKYLFPFAYPILYNQPQVLNIVYLDRDSTKTVRLTSSDFARWDSTCTFHYNDIYKLPHFLFQYNPKEKIALFDLNTFFEGDYEAYNEAIINAIDSLHKYDIQHLFLDFSQNSGGHRQYGAILLNYLNFPEWDKSNGKQYTYNSKLYLIQSNHTASAAVTFSARFKYHRLGIIIGEESGGLTASYSNSIIKRLPNSQLVICCATGVVVTDGGQWDGHGVLPDIEYPIRETRRFKSFTWEELKDMLTLIDF
jgi:hypothetical protein